MVFFMPRFTEMLGVIGVVIAFTGIGISIALTPWFNFYDNALSDLGYCFKSEVAPIFNLTLMVAGFFFALYGLEDIRKRFPKTGFSLVLSGFLLILIGGFDEVYGIIHFYVSVLFFISIGFASIVYSLEAKNKLGYTAFIIGFLSWSVYGFQFCKIGVAVPELLSAIAVSLWVIYESLCPK